MNKTKAEVHLDEDEIGISPGQACVFYSINKFGDKVLGGGWITDTVSKYLSTKLTTLSLKKLKQLNSDLKFFLDMI